MRQLYDAEFGKCANVDPATRKIILNHMYAREKADRFTKRYLEKWRSILMDACNIVHAHFFTDDECHIMYAEFSLLSVAFDRLVDAKDPLVAGKRRHFPNFNTTIQRIMERHGIVFDPADWPPSGTRKCVQFSNEILNRLFIEIA